MKTQSLLRVNNSLFQKKPDGYHSPMVFILNKMCRMVGANYHKTDFSSPDWFRKYMWTHEEQEEFEQWMANYLSKNKCARKYFRVGGGSHGGCSKKNLLKIAHDFTWNHGWKTYSG